MKDIIDLIEELELMRSENDARDKLGWSGAYTPDAFLAVVARYRRKLEGKEVK